jgi:peptidoglycan/LPS O-acetylase OafA/YrhL
MSTAFDQRANNFDCLRMILAVLVIFSHSYPLGTGNEIREPFVLATHGQTTGGSIAVDAFFIISGFLITASFERSRTLLSYFKKRACRIYPGFVVASLIGAICVLPLSGGSFTHNSVVGICLDFLIQTGRLNSFHYTHAFTSNPTTGAINGSMWTIFYEFLCYIGLAILGIFTVLRFGWMLLLLLSAATTLNLFLVTHPSSAPIRLYVIPRFMSMFVAGIVFYHYRRKIPLRTYWMICALLLLTFAAWLRPLWAVIFPIAGAYLIFSLAFHPSIRFHGFGRFGDFSYGTYLYAYPIQQLIMQWLGRAVSPLILFSLALPLTICAAICSWYGVERWFLRKTHETTKYPVQSVVVAERANVS